MNRNKNTQVFQLILLHFNHKLIHIVFNTLQKLHRVISMDASSDHLRPTEEPQLRYILLYSENLKIVTFNTKRILIYLSRLLRCPLLLFQLYFKNQVSFHYWYIGVHLLLVMYFTLKDTVTKDYGTETSKCDIFYTVGRGVVVEGECFKAQRCSSAQHFWADYSYRLETLLTASKGTQKLPQKDAFGKFPNASVKKITD